MPRVALSLIILAGCSTQPTLPEHDYSQYPGVAQVEFLIKPTRPTRRIVHILDWHYISPEHFSADTPGDNYEEHLELVRTIQASQRTLLERLGVQAVYVE